MRLGGANIPLHEVSKRCRIPWEVSKALRLEEPLDGINHRQRSVDLAYRLEGISPDYTFKH